MDDIEGGKYVTKHHFLLLYTTGYEKKESTENSQ